MSWSLAVAALGVVALAAILIDFLLTTMGAATPGLLSARVSRGVWAVLCGVLPDRAWARRLLGPAVMTGVAALWILGVSGSWTLIYQGASRAVVDAESGAAASFWADYSFIGDLLSTLGGQTSQPGSVGWSVLSSFVAVNGMVILTLAVSFILTTTQTVISGRAQMAQFDTLDLDQDCLRASLRDSLTDLVSGLVATPFALYYSSPSPDRRLPRGLIRIAEAGRRDPRDMAFLRTVLNDLPGFDPPAGLSDDAWLTALRGWSAPFRFRS